MSQIKSQLDIIKETVKEFLGKMNFNGRVAVRHEGFVSVERLEEEIRRLLVERDAGRLAVSSGYPPGTR